MPEMPEVITVVKDLKSKVLGKTFSKITVLKDKMIHNCSIEEFISFLKNETINDIFNVGKHIVFSLSNDKFLLSHLRMTGKYFTYHKYREPIKHDYVIFQFSDNSMLFYNDSRQFGTFNIKTKENLWTTKPLSELGKIPGETKAKEFYERIKNKRIPIKQVLLDQTLILGIGNIYANEALWMSKINPKTPANSLSLLKIETIINNAQLVMDKATKLGGSSISSYTSLDNKKGNFQDFLNVHLRENKPCKICGSPIVKEWINKRSTYYCPICQKK